MSDLLASRYRILEVLGRGAMGVVYRAYDTALDRTVALKELAIVQGVTPEEAKERFLVEARAAARLAHPNIVGIHDVLTTDDRVLIAMELIDGPTLGEVIAGSGAQSPSVVREIMAQVADALAAAHTAGVVHRDLKPDNIFWSGGRAVVADFGLARIGRGVGTVAGTIMGTPGYMAPEQIRGQAMGPPVDVFAWAVTAYELTTGEPPFGHPSENDPTALAYRIVHEPHIPLALPGDPVLADVVNDALAKDPSRRPADGVALVAELGGVRSPAAPPPTKEDVPGHSARTRGPIAWVAGGLATAALLIVTVVLLAGGAQTGNARGATTTTTTTTTSTTTTTAPPVPFPTEKGPIPAGFYLSTTVPPLSLRMPDGWQVVVPGRADWQELTAAGENDQRFLSFVRVDQVYKYEFELRPGDDRDSPGSTVSNPPDLLGYLAQHPRLAVTDRRVETIGGRMVVSAEVDVKAGYRHDVCGRQSVDGSCVVIIPIQDSRFLLATGNRNRIYVLRTGDSTMIAVAESRPDQYEALLGSVRTILSSISFP